MYFTAKTDEEFFQIVHSINEDILNGRTCVQANAVDVIYNYIEDLLLAEKITQVDAILKRFPAPTLPRSLPLALLIATRPWKAKLAHREVFLSAVKEVILQHDPANFKLYFLE